MTSLRYSGRVPSFAMTLVVVFAASSRAEPSPARIWLSLSDERSSSPEAPAFTLEVGQSRRVYIWAQPQRSVDGSFETLLNWSLNVTTAGVAAFDILDNFQVNEVLMEVPPEPGAVDPAPITVGRFDPLLTRDSDSESTRLGLGPLTSSASEPQVRSSSLDRVTGLVGAVANSTTFAGVGGDDADQDCVDCGPSWVLGWFEIAGVADSGSQSVFLQIGDLGISHGFGPSTLTSVVFGDDADGSALNGSLDRGVSSGDADLVVNAAPFLAGDYNGDGVVDAADYTVWRDNFGSDEYLLGDTTKRSVDESDFLTWSSNFGSGASVVLQAVSVVPEPGAGTIAFLLAGVCSAFVRSNPFCTWSKRNGKQPIASRLK